jgi:hypothetical protein
MLFVVGISCSMRKCMWSETSMLQDCGVFKCMSVYHKWTQIIHLRITLMSLFGCSMLFGDLHVLFPVFATDLSEFNLVPVNEDTFLFACRVEWNVLLSNTVVLRPAQTIYFVQRIKRICKFTQPLSYTSFPNYGASNQLAKGTRALLVRRQSVCRSILQPHTR